MSDISCMSFNILSYDTHKSGFEPPADRFPYIVATIDKYAPDLIGVQEACEAGSSEAAVFDWYGEMIRAMEERGYAWSSLKSHGDKFDREKQNIGCGLIIFYRKDRFTLNDSGLFQFEHDKVRYFHWVKLTDEKFGKPVLFTNTHFSINQKVVDERVGIAGTAFRTVEAVKLINFWAKNCPPDTALFATGDYNSLPSADPQVVLRSKQFKPSNLVAKAWDDCGSMYASRQFYTLDYCYVNPEATDIDEYRVIRDLFPSDSDCPLAGYPSDHRAIMTYATYRTDVPAVEI